MNLGEITLVLGLDAAHLEELRWTWPTWMRFKPELREMPALVFYDPAQIVPERVSFIHQHPNVRWVPWEMPAAGNQREKMITGFVQVPAREVQTPWYLKLDTDAVATGPGPWIKEEWFLPSGRGRTATMVSAKWTYSKPHDVIQRLDEWAKGLRRLRPIRIESHRLAGAQPSAASANHFVDFLLPDGVDAGGGRLAWDGRAAAASFARHFPFLLRQTDAAANRARADERVSVAAHPAVEDSGAGPQPRDGTSGARRSYRYRGSARAVTRGVISYNCGTGAAVRLLVSLASLRKFYAGPVTILSDGEEYRRTMRR